MDRKGEQGVGILNFAFVWQGIKFTVQNRNDIPQSTLTQARHRSYFDSHLFISLQLFQLICNPLRLSPYRCFFAFAATLPSPSSAPVKVKVQQHLGISLSHTQMVQSHCVQEECDFLVHALPSIGTEITRNCSLANLICIHLLDFPLAIPSCHNFCLRTNKTHNTVVNQHGVIT